MSFVVQEVLDMHIHKHTFPKTYFKHTFRCVHCSFQECKFEATSFTRGRVFLSLQTWFPPIHFPTQEHMLLYHVLPFYFSSLHPTVAFQWPFFLKLCCCALHFTSVTSAFVSFSMAGCFHLPLTHAHSAVARPQLCCIPSASDCRGNGMLED